MSGSYDSEVSVLSLWDLRFCFALVLTFYLHFYVCNSLLAVYDLFSVIFLVIGVFDVICGKRSIAYLLDRKIYMDSY